MDKQQILKNLIDYYCDGNQSKFAKKVGVTPQTVAGWLTRKSFDLDLLFEKLECVSAKYLLCGCGDIVEKSEKTPKKLDVSYAPVIADQTILTLIDRITELSEQNARLKYRIDILENKK